MRYINLLFTYLLVYCNSYIWCMVHKHTLNIRSEIATLHQHISGHFNLKYMKRAKFAVLLALIRYARAKHYQFQYYSVHSNCAEDVTLMYTANTIQ